MEPSAEPLKEIDFSNKIDFAAFVPYQMLTMLQSQNKISNMNRLNEMRTILVGGDIINTELSELVNQISSPVYHTYGMTETVSHIAYRRLNGPGKSEYFTILKGVQIDHDERGCLMVKSSVTSNEWVVTNDLIERIDASQFRWIGRADLVINSGGIKIQIVELEKQIGLIFEELKINLNFLIVSKSDPNFNQKAVLVIESIDHLDLRKQEVLEIKMSEQIDKLKIPKEIIYIPFFPRTPTGKPDRAKVTRIFMDN